MLAVMRNGHALGPVCVTTMPRGIQPLIDSAATFVEKWGDGRHGSLVVRFRSQCLVIAIRGTKPSTFTKIAEPRRALRRWWHRNDPPRGVSMHDCEPAHG